MIHDPPQHARIEQRRLIVAENVLGQTAEDPPGRRTDREREGEDEATGVRRIFLLVDPLGPVRLYEGLGFREATRIASTRARRQLVAGGGR